MSLNFRYVGWWQNVLGVGLARSSAGGSHCGRPSQVLDQSLSLEDWRGPTQPFVDRVSASPR